MTWQLTFGNVDPGVPLLYEDADYDGLAVGVNQGSAAAHARPRPRHGGPDRAGLTDGGAAL